MAATPENKVKAAIDATMKRYEYVDVPRLSSAEQGRYRILWWYKPQAGIYGRAGIPDFVGCISGHMFGVEAKAEGGVLTELQRRTITNIEQAGGTMFVIVGTKNVILLDEWLREQVAAFRARIIMNV